MIWLKEQEVRVFIKDDAKENATGKVVSVRASTSRKATNYDKFEYKGYVESSWWLEFKGEKAVSGASKLKKGDVILLNEFILTSGEKYAEEDGKGKYSPTKIQVMKWSFKDAGSKRADAKTGSKSTVDDDFPEF